MTNKILILILISIKILAQDCPNYIIKDKIKLYTYDCNPSNELFYVLKLCKHDGAHKSIIEVTKSNEYDTTEITGKLKIDVGHFENTTSKSEITSLSYQDTGFSYKTQNLVDKQTDFYWKKWYGSLSFKMFVPYEPKIELTAKCVNAYSENAIWGEWKILWENKLDTIKVEYRTKSYFDKVKNKYKTDVELQGPKNYKNGEVTIRGIIGNDINEPSLKFILTENGFSVVRTVEAKVVTEKDITLTSKFYKKTKTVRVKSKAATMGVRG